MFQHFSVCIFQTSVNNTIEAADIAQEYIDNNVADLVTAVSIFSYVSIKHVKVALNNCTTMSPCYYFALRSAGICSSHISSIDAVFTYGAADCKLSN